MKLKIKNFGPLTKGGTIDLDKRFYVFVGKNGSGKTYLANLMYGVLHRNYTSSIESILRNEKDLFQFDKNQNLIFDEKMFAILGGVNNSLITSVFGGSSSSLEKADVKIFSYEEDFLNKEINWLFSYTKGGTDEESVYVYDKPKNSNVISWSITNEEPAVVKFEEGYKVRGGIFDDVFQRAFCNLCSRWLTPISSRNNSIFLPANRTSLLSLWRYIASTERKERDILFEMNSKGNLLTQDALKNFQSLYTKPVKDLIAQIEYFDSVNSEPVSYYSDLVEELEELMGGKIKVHEPKEGIGRKRFTFEMAENGEELELFLASSAVNQLSILYIYLKYWAKEKGNFLMIDEPEINLHPENQIKLVNILMKFADRNDNRVLITTHSTLLADAVNNHIRIGHLQTTEDGKAWLNDNPEWLNENQLDINEHINHNDFGVYYFNGNAIKNYAVKDYGVFFKDFADAEDNIQKTANTLKAEIYKELHSKKPQ